MNPVLTLKANAEEPLTLQIVGGIIEEVREKRWRPGMRVPSIRVFAEAHGVSTFTVVEAYDRLVAQGVLVAKRGSGLQPTPESLKGKSIGVLQGSTQEDYVRKHWGTQGVNIVTYENQDQIFADLAAGRLDGAVQEVQTATDGFLSKPQGKGFDFAGAALKDPATLGEGTGFGMRKDDAALKAKVVAAIDSLRKDGTLTKLSMKYFGRDIVAK